MQVSDKKSKRAPAKSPASGDFQDLFDTFDMLIPSTLHLYLQSVKTLTEKPRKQAMQGGHGGNTRERGAGTVAFADRRPEATAHESAQRLADGSPQARGIAQMQSIADQGTPNRTGLPDTLKTGIENLSGYAMDDVRTHYNSDKPAQLNAHAFAQGTDIHIAPGQEKHLPHEAWHVVQQKQGRVRPTVQLQGGVNVNDDAGLEEEADVIGVKAHALLQAKSDQPIQLAKYTVKRNFPLSKGVKTIEKKEAEKNRPEQSAKSRAKGELYAVLRSQFPIPHGKKTDNFEEQEEARGNEYLIRRKMIDDEFEAKNITDEQESVSIYRAALTPGKGEGARAGSSQATGVSKYLGLKMIGAHLVKREWGGSDNMWNVVAWPQTAENKWADGFEQPIDNAATWGLEPGEIDIEVEKDDEAISKMKIEPFIEGAILRMKNDGKAEDELESSASRSLAPHFMDPINRERHKLNRMIESVPRKASGTNNAPSILTGESRTTKTDISTQDTGYTAVLTAAVGKLKTLANNEISKKSDRDIVDDQEKDKQWAENIRPVRAEKWKEKNPEKELPTIFQEGSLRPDRFLSLRDSDKREKEKRSDERTVDWDKEKNTYDSDKFELKHNVRF